MKRKTLIICLLVLIFVGGIAATIGFLFRVQEITVAFSKSDYQTLFIDNESNKAISSYESEVAKIMKGKNILFSLNKKKITAAIEDSDPLVRVTNIEAKFPNKIAITVQERYPMYYCTQDENTAILDYSLRVLSTDADFIQDRKIINLSDQFIFNDDFAGFTVGDNIENYLSGDESDKRVSTLVLMAQCFFGHSYTEEQLCTLINNISFDEQSIDPFNMTIVLSFYASTKTSIHIVIENYNDNFNQRLGFAWECLQTKTGFPASGRLIVSFDTVSGKLMGYWEPNWVEE